MLKYQIINGMAKTDGSQISHTSRGLLDSLCTWMMETGLKEK